MTLLRPVDTEPDVLEVISNLSNDEVFTPPKVANAVLDLLPAEVWSNPDLRWLDPGCKTGVFLREATKRLMAGLSPVIADEQERLGHILNNMMHGIAITELTSLMSRRTLYCSKDATGEHSAVRMSTPAGNIWFRRTEHAYVKGRCTECGAAETLMEKEGSDNHAYAFIHADGFAAVEKEHEMNFDVIVGNPPYQMEADADGQRSQPIYSKFVDQAKQLNPQYISMVMPSRWMAGGWGLNGFRADMLADHRVRTLVDFQNASDVFPAGVSIKGGVCYFLWGQTNGGACRVSHHRGGTVVGPTERRLDEFDVFVRDQRSLPVLHKALASSSMLLSDQVSALKPFGTVGLAGHAPRRIGEPGDLRAHMWRNHKRTVGYISRSEITKGVDLIDRWKVLVPKAGSDGGANPPDVVLGKPIIAGPGEICTYTFLAVGPFNDETECESFVSYLRTRFFRFLVSLRKISQDTTRRTYSWVPQQSWDRTWTDAELYAKYGITEVEQAYIAEMIREMPA